MQKNTKETKEPKTRTNKKVVYSESEDEEMSPDTIERTSKFLVQLRQSGAVSIFGGINLNEKHVKESNRAYARYLHLVKSFNEWYTKQIDTRGREPSLTDQASYIRQLGEYRLFYVITKQLVSDPRKKHIKCGYADNVNDNLQKEVSSHSEKGLRAASQQSLYTIPQQRLRFFFCFEQGIENLFHGRKPAKDHLSLDKMDLDQETQNKILEEIGFVPKCKRVADTEMYLLDEFVETRLKTFESFIAGLDQEGVQEKIKKVVEKYGQAPASNKSQRGRQLSRESVRARSLEKSHDSLLKKLSVTPERGTSTNDQIETRMTVVQPADLQQFMSYFQDLALKIGKNQVSDEVAKAQIELERERLAMQGKIESEKVELEKFKTNVAAQQQTESERIELEKFKVDSAVREKIELQNLEMQAKNKELERQHQREELERQHQRKRLDSLEKRIQQDYEKFAEENDDEAYIHKKIKRRYCTSLKRHPDLFSFLN